MVNAEGTIPVIAIFSTTRVPDLSLTLNDLLLKYKSDPKVFTYAIGENSDRFELRRLACITRGAYYQLQGNSDAAAVSVHTTIHHHISLARVLTSSYLDSCIELSSTSSARERFRYHPTTMDK